METTALVVGHNRTSDLQSILAIRDNYSGHVKHFVAWCLERDHDVTEESIRGYFEHLNESDYSAGTIAVKRAAVKSRVRSLLQNEPIDTQVRLDRVLANLDKAGPTRAPKINSSAVGADKVLSYAEVEKLIASASPAITQCIKVLFATGCRVSEMLGIKKGHCERQGERVRIRILGKGKKERYLVVPARVYDAVQEHFRGETYLFETSGGKPIARTYVSDSIAKLGRKVLERRISAHTLRHTFATQMLRRGVMIDALSRYLGHSSVSITLDLYCHNELSDDEIYEHIVEIL